MHVDETLLPPADADDQTGSLEPGKQEQLRVTGLLDDYFKLDYEEKVAGIACRCGLKSVIAMQCYL